MATTIISGTSAIEDTVHIGTNVAHYDKNYGTSSSLAYDNHSGYSCMLRMLTEFIPLGDIFEVLFSWKPSGGHIPTIYRITESNNWVEGTANGIPEIGSPCWNWCKYNTQAWAGSLGCATPDVDFETINAATDGFKGGGAIASIPLPVSWFTDWRSEEFINNGFILKSTSISNVFVPSTEDTSDQPFFTVNYLDWSTYPVMVIP